MELFDQDAPEEIVPVETRLMKLEERVYGEHESKLELVKGALLHVVKELEEAKKILKDYSHVLTALTQIGGKNSEDILELMGEPEKAEEVRQRMLDYTARLSEHGIPYMKMEDTDGSEDSGEVEDDTPGGR